MDARRERNNIFKHLDRFHTNIGGTVVWFKFDLLNSQYDPTYDEGGKSYHIGKIVPYLWIDKVEPVKTMGAEGQRATERLHAAFSVRTLDETGIGGHEAGGLRRRDPQSPDLPWVDSRLNDMLFYKDRWWEINGFNIRDQVKEMPVVVGVTAIETQLRDEHMWDLFPGNYRYASESTTTDPPLDTIFDGGSAAQDTDETFDTVFDGGSA